ncbi:MAG: UDP-glucose/GDP-mannose dehydrogenase family protein [Dehalococcoidia bacterium]|jgi:UDPglucose 6-dehydrogenase
MDKAEIKPISVVGLGVVGLTTAVGFALKGHRVVGIDIDSEKVSNINEGISPVYEEGLSRAMQDVRIHATTDFNKMLDTDLTFLCGGTPGQSDGSINLKFVRGPAEQTAEVLKNKSTRHVVVMRSTVVPGTTETYIEPLFQDNRQVGICVNPEFLREGTALEDFTHPNRIIIGEKDEEAGDALCNVYRNFRSPIIRTNFRTAEMIKYASNTFLATKVSFINEIGNICKKLGINVFDVTEAIGYDMRIGTDYLRAGLGFGGFCLPKDTAALIARSQELGYEPELLKTVIQLNERQPGILIDLLKMHVPYLKGKTVGILGLAFKPNTDDVRKTKSIDIVQMLLNEGALVRAYDPQAMSNFSKLFPDIEYSTPEKVLQSDAVLILTEWDVFNTYDYKGKIVIDGRKIPKAEEADIYEGISWASYHHPYFCKPPRASMG